MRSRTLRWPRMSLRRGRAGVARRRCVLLAAGDVVVGDAAVAAEAPFSVRLYDPTCSWHEHGLVLEARAYAAVAVSLARPASWSRTRASVAQLFVSCADRQVGSPGTRRQLG